MLTISPSFDKRPFNRFAGFFGKMKEALSGDFTERLRRRTSL